MLKSEVYEQFNMLLCNPSLSSAEQKQLLYNILFVDHTNPRHWHQYLTYLAEEYPHKKESLITLVFKALSVVPEAPNKDHPDFIRLHLRLAALDQCVVCCIVLSDVCSIWPERGLRVVSCACVRLSTTFSAGQPVQARQRYRIMQKRKIGIRSAEYYVQYAQLEQEQRNFASAKQILERGVAAHAEPRHLLIHALDALKQEQQKAELAGGDDEATRPNSSVVVPSSQKPETRARSGDVPAVTPRARAVAAADSDDDNTRPLPAAVASTAAPSTPAPTPTPATATSAAATTTTATTDSAASVQRASSRLAARKRKEDEPTTTSRPIKRIGARPGCNQLAAFAEERMRLIMTVCRVYVHRAAGHGEASGSGGCARQPDNRVQAAESGCCSCCSCDGSGSEGDGDRGQGERGSAANTRSRPEANGDIPGGEVLRDAAASHAAQAGRELGQNPLFRTIWSQRQHGRPRQARSNHPRVDQSGSQLPHN